MIRYRIITFTALLWLAPASHSRAELPRYSVTPVRQDSLALNNRGEILSYVFDLTGAVSYRLEQADGGQQTGGLNTPPAGYDGLSINRSTLSDTGMFALEVYRQNGPDYQSEAAIADLRTGAVQILTGTPVNGDDDRSPKSSNGGGYVALQAGPDRGQLQPYLYSSAAGWLPLGNLTAGGDGRPLGVNAAGTVVGRTGNSTGQTVPFIYTDSGGMQPITDNGTAVFGQAVAISNSGLITGTGNGRAFIFDSNTLEFRFVTEAAQAIRAVDINDTGAVLGISGSGAFAFVTLYQEDFGLASLSSLLEGNEDPFNPAWLMKDAVDINNNGWILGAAQRVADTTYHQVLLRPVPDPGLTLLLGCAALATLRRRRT